jgi:hypothetical protein
MIDSTPPELWLPDTGDDPLEPDLSAESLVWASPPDAPGRSNGDPPTVTGAPDGSL